MQITSRRVALTAAVAIPVILTARQVDNVASGVLLASGTAITAWAAVETDKYGGYIGVTTLPVYLLGLVALAAAYLVA